MEVDARRTDLSLLKSTTAMQPFFVPVNEEFLARKVYQATERVFCSASGVSQTLAEAIVAAAQTRSKLQVAVVLDSSPLPARMGLADTSGLEILNSAQSDLSNLSVRQSPRLRLCIMIADACGWAWWPRVQAVEPPRVSPELPNAMVLHPKQVEYVLSSFSIDSQRLASLPSGEVSSSEPPPPPDRSGVPSEPLSSADVHKRGEDLRMSPPEKFHELRKISVYRPLLQYVEGADLVGVRTEAMSVSLPEQIANLPVPTDSAARLRTSLKLFVDDAISSDLLERQLRRYKDFFCPSIKPPYGRLILKRETGAFEAALQAFQDQEIESFRHQFSQSLKQQRSRLGTLVRDIYTAACVEHISSVKRDEDAHKWLDRHLDAVLSGLGGRPGRIRLTKPIYKDITYQTLNDPDFIRRVRAAFPQESWPRHELYASQVAAEATD